MPLILGANSDTGDFITNSLTYELTDTPYLNKTISSSNASVRRQVTISTWIKRCRTGTFQTIISAGTNGADTSDDVSFQTSDKILVDLITSQGRYQAQSSGVFRDVAAWYHVVVKIDTTAGSNRILLYVNNELQATNSTGIPQNDTISFTADLPHEIGRRSVNNGSPADYYMAEFNFLDGLSYDPSYFGETNDNGVWVPKKYAGGYGTNGFHLEFKETGTSANAAGIGADTSGNGNHFTPNNLAATDIGIDTPQNNYCTINSVFADDGNNLVVADFSQGNRKMLSTVDGWKFGRGTFLLEAGKWYVEVKATEAGAGENGRFGLQPSQGGITLGNTDDNDTFEGINVGFAGSDTNLQKLDTGSGSTIFSDFASGNTAMLAIDLDNNKMWIGKEGTWYNNNNASTTLSSSNHDIALPTVSLGWVFGLGMTRNGSNNITFEYNWGNPSHSISSGNADADGHGNFEFAVPDGFFAVNSKNLAEYG